MQQADAKYCRSVRQCLFSSVLLLMLATAEPAFTQEDVLPGDASPPPAAEMDLPPEAPSEEEMPIAETTNITGNIYGSTPAAGRVYSNYWQGSMMFREKEINNLLAVYQHYKRNKDTAVPTPAQPLPDESIADLLPPEPVDPTQQEVLQFSVGSLIYQSPEAWSVWINGQRYSGEDLTEGFLIDESRLSVVSANEQEVTFLWIPNSVTFPILLERLEQKETLEAESGPSPQKAYNEELLVDEESQTVSITMHPNQTFISRFMSVFEGTNSTKLSSSLSERYSQFDQPPIDPDAPLLEGEVEDMRELPGGLNVRRTAPGQDPTRAIADGLIEQYQNTVPNIQNALGGANQPQ